MKKTTILLIAILTLTACSSDDDSSSNTISNSGLLKTLEVASDFINVTETYTYTSGNKLSSITNNLGGSETYSYTGELLTRIDIIDADGLNESGYITLEYNSDNRLTSSTTFYTSDDIIFSDTSYRYDFTYNPDDTITRKEYEGDLASQTTLSGTDTITLEYGNIINITSNNYEYSNSYDNKNGIWKNIYASDILHLIGHIDSNNNNLLEEVIDYDSDPTETRTFSYTYNSSNYPIQANAPYNSVITFSYY
jgi:hypothetical protein